MEISELQFWILDAVADDIENVEQMYLWANRDFFEGKRQHLRFLLHILIDEVIRMVEAGYIRPEQTDNESRAPLNPFNPALTHYYWFGRTEKGKREWEAYPYVKAPEDD